MSKEAVKQARLTDFLSLVNLLAIPILVHFLPQFRFKAIVSFLPLKEVIRQEKKKRKRGAFNRVSYENKVKIVIYFHMLKRTGFTTSF